WAIIALGGWEKEFAPPSIVEYYLNFTTVVALDAAIPNLERHFDTRGCVLSFNAALADARFSVLAGRICSSCAEKIGAQGSKQMLEDARLLVDRPWLGGPMAPSDVAVTVTKLGYDLFRTTGIKPTKPTFKERFLATLEQEGLKNTLNITFQMLL